MELHHVAITVKEMERSLAFYRDALGLKVLADSVVSGPEIDTAVMEIGANLRMVFLGNEAGAKLELLEWRSPPIRERTLNELRYTLSGIVEICLEVADMEKLGEDLKKKGLKFRYPPFVLGKTKITHLVDPDGVPVELIQRTGDA